MIDFSAMAKSLRIVDRLQPFQLRNVNWDAPGIADPKSDASSRSSNVVQRPKDTVNISAEAHGKLAGEKDLPEVDIEDIVKTIQEQKNNYDYTIANAAPINTYDETDQSLIDKVLLTRAATEISGNISGARHGKGLELVSASAYNVSMHLPSEISSLKEQLSQQMADLGIERSQSFSISQDKTGQVIVSGGDSTANTKTSELLNSSDHFKETFHLLKTAENSYKALPISQNFADLSFKIDVTEDVLTSDVQILKKSPEGSVLARIPKISASEMYFLARTGVSAIVARYEN